MTPAALPPPNKRLVLTVRRASQARHGAPQHSRKPLGRHTPGVRYDSRYTIVEWPLQSQRIGALDMNQMSVRCVLLGATLAIVAMTALGCGDKPSVDTPPQPSAGAESPPAPLPAPTSRQDANRICAMFCRKHKDDASFIACQKECFQDHGWNDLP